MTRVMAFGAVRLKDGTYLHFGVLLVVDDPAEVETLFSVLFPNADYQYSTQED